MNRRTLLPLALIAVLAALVFISLPSGKDLKGEQAAEYEESANGIDLNNVDPAVYLELAISNDVEFSDWVEQWRKSHSSSVRAELLKNGTLIAIQRASTMKSLVRENPDAALDLALSYSEYDALPAALKAIVEEPFSDSGSVDVVSICSENLTHYRLEYLDGSSYAIFMPNRHRIESSKNSLPIQGVRIDGVAVLRPAVFHVLVGADVDFVKENWPSGQNSPENDYATGQPIKGEGVTAVAGGHVFHFQNEETLQQVETALAKADAKPSRDVSSQWILTQVSGDGFPFDDFSKEIVSANYASTTGAKTTLIIMVNFQDVTAPPNQIALEQVVDTEVSNALAAYSYNTTSMDATVYDTVVTISGNAADYLNDPQDGNSATKDYNDIHSEAVAAYLSNEGGGTPTPTSVYDTVCVYFGNAGFSWAGLASVGGQRMWLDNSINDEVILHEFGHNYGLKHANYWAYDDSNGSSTNPVDPTGTSDEYGDDFDVMGDGSTEDGHFQMGAKQDLGWIGSNDWEDLVDSSDNGTYRVFRFDHISASGNQALRIGKSATSDHYWIGYRKDYASLQSFAKGAYLTWERAQGSTNRNQTWLVDTTPQSSDGKNDAPITLGRTYSDTASEVHITPVGLGGSAPNEYIDVVVNFGSFAGNTAPTGSISGPTTTDARQVELFSASATDIDGDTLAYSWDLGDGVIHSNSSSITYSWLSGGTYNISVTVSDMKGGSVTLNKSVTVTDSLTSWTARTSGSTKDLNGIASNSTHVVAVGGNALYANGGVILRSADGNSWSDVSPSGNNKYFNDVIWTGSQFIAVGQDYDFGLSAWEGVIYTSPTGETWTRSYESNLPNTELNGIAYDGSSTLVVVGDSAAVLRKNGAGSWTSVATTILGSHVLQDVAYGDGKFVLVGHATSPSYNGDVEVRSSTDGLIWTDYSANTGLESWQDFREIEYFEGAFHAGGFYGRACRSTDGGQTWSTTQNGDRYQINGIASISGVHFAVGHNNDEPDDSEAPDIDTDLISSDGISWIASVPGVLPDRNEIAAFKGTFITVGENGSIRQSGSVTTSTDFSTHTDTYFPGGGSDAEASANSDNDWANNFTEYALGGDPSDGTLTPGKPIFSVDSSSFPVFEVTRAAKQTDVAYSIWWSTNLIDWTQDGLSIELDNETTLRVRGTNATATEEKAFFKLQLSQ